MTDIEIRDFEIESAGADDLLGYHRIVAASQQVDLPDDPPLTYENLVGRLRNPFTGFGPLRHWTAHRGGEMAGVANMYFPEVENSHLVIANVRVHPQSRGQGIGSTLARAIVPAIRADGRRLVECWQVPKGGTGDSWATRLGFETVHETVQQVLLIAEADTSLWEVAAPTGYRLERWIGAAPDALVASYVQAREAIHDSPLGQSSMSNPQWTVDRMRAAEAERRRLDVESRTVVAVHEATGTVAGLTELEVQPHQPTWAFQRDTAVLAAHRGHGLGRWIKAHMARWLLADRPDLERFWTTTGAVNTHMIRVNHQLGFTTTRSAIVLTQSVATLAARLEAQP
ncbi:GNAT family N-acetyltransferase [Solihabitans fulvus]|uniref:GNAT family N-acetyltransferase n=1 Tax=Solihabitans fulvus TaxID=1892852 RepID=A0A5B2WZU1_9PSEU|nr:GNAT family N-acetyltransferase [Solihabitans fulvus]KAA2256342.1 GNAT family N-acetyltransferase [Solihabitans fulvus]